MAGLSDVAALAGVSKATASRALSGRGYVSAGTRAKVKDAASAIGFVASATAASLVTGQSHNVGVLIPILSRWYFSEVLEGIESALREAGYDLTLYRLSDDEDERRRVFDYFLMRKSVDAVIAVGIAMSAEEIGLLRSLRKPLVGIGGDVPGIPTVSIDDVAAARKATDHLIGLGHRRILHLGGDLEHQMDFRVHEKRLRGVRDSLDAAGLRHPDDFRPVPYSIQGGHAAGLAVLADALTRPTAIVAGCDEIAIGVIIAARQLGIPVPTRLSVVGIDGHPLAEMFQLTTIRQVPSALGTLAVSLALDRLLDDDLDPEAVEWPIEMVVRGTTTAPFVDELR